MLSDEQQKRLQLLRQRYNADARGRRVTAKYTPKYPEKAEQELRRTINAYNRIAQKEFKKHLPEILELYRQEQPDARMDSLFDLRQGLMGIFGKISDAIGEQLEKFDLPGRLGRVANRTRKISNEEWKLCVKKSIGVDLLENYYNKEFYSELTNGWITDSLSAIRGLPEQQLSKLQEILTEGFNENRPVNEITDSIQNELNISRNSASFLARDQIGNLNAQLSKRQQRDAGVTKYKWVDSGDGRVRSCHHSYNGMIFDWKSPPAMWTLKRGVRYLTGRRCHPGEDYGCRCRAEPVFDIDILRLHAENPEE